MFTLSFTHSFIHSFPIKVYFCFLLYTLPSKSLMGKKQRKYVTALPGISRPMKSKWHGPRPLFHALWVLGGSYDVFGIPWRSYPSDPRELQGHADPLRIPQSTCRKGRKFLPLLEQKFYLKHDVGSTLYGNSRELYLEIVLIPNGTLNMTIRKCPRGTFFLAVYTLLWFNHISVFFSTSLPISPSFNFPPSMLGPLHGVQCILRSAPSLSSILNCL